MNESDAIQALSSIGETAGTYVALYFTVTFAYVTVAYLVGGSLSRFQCIAASTVYAISSILFGVTALIYTDAWLLLKERESTIFDNVRLLQSAMWFEGAAMMLIGISSLSLYFMYDMRRHHNAT